MEQMIARIQSTLRARLSDTRVTLPRYVAVSVIGVLIGTLALWFFTDIVGLFYLVAGTLGAFLSVLNDFIFHRAWTFSHVEKDRHFTTISKRFGKFAASKAVGFFLALAVLAFFTQVVGFQYLISNIFAVGASFAWNYGTSSQWVWARRVRRESE
jgi:dolichol-phosphate mannosyltransferase